MFLILKRELQGLELIFLTLEFKFQSLGHKIHLEGKTFSPRGKKKSSEREKKFCKGQKDNSPKAAKNALDCKDFSRDLRQPKIFSHICLQMWGKSCNFVPEIKES